ncbi:MAG TPA: 1-acyl-sn-glycerol-3-phosphate acyltransferase [Planctomycetia bacterium]|nr:1-acyl-sn-glycerol-3-phosphate acyltransferase [Planctomycetia bacterium]
MWKRLLNDCCKKSSPQVEYEKSVEVLRAVWYGFLRILAQLVFPAFWRYRSFGRENIPDSGGVLIVSNHQSYADPLLIGVGLNRQIHIMARRSLFHKHVLFRWLILSLNAFPLNNNGSDVGAIKEAIRRLKRGNLVLMFPEGTRTEDGSIGEIHPGIAAIAKRSCTPVVPAVIDGAFETWPRTRKLFRFGPAVKVAFGRPLYCDGSAEEFTKEVASDMLRLQSFLKSKC